MIIKIQPVNYLVNMATLHCTFCMISPCLFPSPQQTIMAPDMKKKLYSFGGKMFKVTRCKSTSFIMQLTQCTKEHQRTWLMLLDVVDSNNNNNDNLILPQDTSKRFTKKSKALLIQVFSLQDVLRILSDDFLFFRFQTQCVLRAIRLFCFLHQ